MKRPSIMLGKTLFTLLIGLLFIQLGNTQTCYVTNTGTTYHSDSSCGRLRSINTVSYKQIKHTHKPCNTKKCSTAREGLGINTASQTYSYGSTAKSVNVPASSSSLIVSGRNIKAYDNSIKLLTWNLKKLGRAKDQTEINAIVKVLKNFDLVALQEVVAIDPAGVQKVALIADLLNRTGSKWDYVYSNPTQLPLENSAGQVKERYAFLWNTSKLSLTNEPFLDEALADICYREPYIAKFRTRNEITFHAITFHSRPHSKKPEREVINLSNYPQRLNSENLIILGDFNMDENNRVWIDLYNQGFEPSIRNSPTTLKQECDDGNYLNYPIDNIYINTSKFHVEDAGRIDIVGNCQNLEIARGISDHLPVYSIIRFR